MSEEPRGFQGFVALSRRRFLRVAALSAAGSILLAACGGDDESEPAATATTSGGQSGQPTPTQAPSGGATATTAPATTQAQATPTQAQAQPKTGGMLRIGVDGEWRALDPPVYANVTDRNVLYAIYDPLADMDENLDIIPALASKWEVSSDALTWTFTLRTGVKFHDGTDFNAEAAKFNIERILNPDTASRLRQELLDITEVQAPDATTLKLVLKQPFTPLISWLTDVPGMMVSPAAVEKFGEDLVNNPVGAGPFAYVSQTKGSELRLRKFADYWKESGPYVDEVIYQPIPDPSVKLAGLRSGALDIIDDVPPNELENVKSASNIDLILMPGTRWRVIHVNERLAPFDNKAIRQALNLAINRDAIIRAVYAGNATPCYGPISPVYKSVFDPNIESYALKYDVDKAKQKLAEGGQPNGFSMTLDISSVPEDIRMGEIIKANLEAIGVKVELIPHEGNAAFESMSKNLEGFQANLSSWTPRPDPDGTLRRHFHSTSPNNYQAYQNPAVDELLDRTRRLPPGDERVRAFQELQRILVDEAPWVYLVFEARAYATAKAVEGLPAIPDALLRPGPVWLNK